MKNVLVVIDKIEDCLKYKSVITKAIDDCIKEVPTVESIVGTITSSSTEDEQLRSYIEIKQKIQKKVYILVTQEINHVNLLESVLHSLYSSARHSVLNLEVGKLIVPSIFTQVLFNVSLKTVIDSDIYSFEKVYSRKQFVDSDIEKHGLKCPVEGFELDEKDTLDVKKYYDHEEKQGSFEVGCVGGTFDHLHDGHKILISMGSFLCKNKFIIGISNQDLLSKKKHKEFLESFELRSQVVWEFVRRLNPGEFEIEIHELKEVYGPTATVARMDLLIVTEETAKGGQMVNDKRKEKGLSQLEIFVVKLIEDDGKEDKISSTYVREFQAKEFARLKSSKS